MPREGLGYLKIRPPWGGGRLATAEQRSMSNRPRKAREMDKRELDKLPELIGIEDAAKAIGLTGDEVAKLCEAGSLPCVKVNGRWLVRKQRTIELVRNPRFDFTDSIDLGTLSEG